VIIKFFMGQVRLCSCNLGWYLYYKESGGLATLLQNKTKRMKTILTTIRHVLIGYDIAEILWNTSLLAIFSIPDCCVTIKETVLRVHITCCKFNFIDKTII